jgi:solute carrier family 13 (sodium-dependent dicarboxylate transporter), member 2/3/5
MRGKFIYKKGAFLVGVVFFVTMIFLPVPNNMEESAWKVLALSGSMSIFWIFEVFPIYATSLFPLVILPFLDIISFQEAAAPFANQIIYLFLGGFFLAIGLENTGLHKRFAMKILYLFGKSPNKLIFGFLLSSASMSTLVNNTSTVLMMLPIAISVISVVKETNLLKTEISSKKFSISLLLCIAYGSSMGGAATLIGTAPNIFMVGFVSSTLGYQIDFVQWLYIGLPFLIISLFVIDLVVNKILFRVDSNENFDSRHYFKKEYYNLGKWKKEEKVVLFVFSSAIFSWVFQPILSNYFKNISDGIIAMTSALLLFIIPIDWDNQKYILDRKSINSIPWDAILLFGGGLSIASAIEKTKLATWLGIELKIIGVLPLFFQILLIVSLIIFLTELTSNTATIIVFLPILSSIALNSGQNPLLFIIPATFAVSCAFMLPVATPPNTIIFGSGLIQISEMTKAGLILNLFYILIITFLTLFLVVPIFKL